MFDLARHKVVNQRVEQDAKTRALHPGGLPRADHFGRMSAGIQLVNQQPRRCPLADRGVSSQHGDLERVNLGDLAGEAVQLAARRRLAHVAKSHPMPLSKLDEFDILGQKIVQPAVDMESRTYRPLDFITNGGGKSTAVGG